MSPIKNVLFLAACLLATSCIKDESEISAAQDAATASVSASLKEGVAKCAECHGAGSDLRFTMPDDPTAALETIRAAYLDRKNAQVNLMILESMVNEQHAAFSEAQKAEFFNFLTGSSAGSLSESLRAAVAQQKLVKMPDLRADTDGWRRLIPKTENHLINAIAQNAAIYTNRGDIRPAYQDDGRKSPFTSASDLHGIIGGDGSHGLARHFYTLFNQDGFMGLLANGFGLHEVDKGEVLTFKWFYIPTDDNGNRLPMLHWRDVLRNDGRHFFTWEYPKHTVFGEVIGAVTDVNGTRTFFPQTMNVRYVVGAGEHLVEVFRPFPNIDDLTAAVKESFGDDHASLKELADKSPMQRGHVFDDYNFLGKGKGGVFNRIAGVSKLPNFSESEVQTLLANRTFRSTLNHFWKKDQNGLTSFAPTTDARFGLVPRNFAGHAVPINSTSCKGCHGHGAITLHQLHPTAPSTIANANSRSYGSVWGNRDYHQYNGSQVALDAEGYPVRDTTKTSIFSLHPFSEQAVRATNFDSRYVRGNFNPYFVNNGMLRAYTGSETQLYRDWYE